MNLPSSPKRNILYMAPLQGFTDYAFRSAFASLFETPDAAFSPYLDTHKPDHRIYRDVLPERNTNIKLIPQVLGNDANEIIPIINGLQQMGYQEIDWNLGCPYPMVTKKCAGAGLLPHAERIDKILNNLPLTSFRLSVKMRLGLSNKDEWKEVVPILNRYPLTEVIVHSRTAAQMYKGEPDIISFTELAGQLSHPLCYNGNIFTLEQYNTLSNQMPLISRWMLGRGLISNPLLIQEIRTGQKASSSDIQKAIEQLHNQLLYLNSTRLSGNSHIFNKMKPYWEYFAPAFTGQEKALKKIKKSVTLEAYKIACNEVFRG